ncbi:MAG: hypothetical protein CMO55_08830 [Verrucomicrobiales bacterium]|nr:hypothetical protein [Verrucomicrobiales bacterium]
MTITEAKARLPLPELARRLGLPGPIPDRDGKAFTCWWPDRHNNGDRHPSMSFCYQLTGYKCHACGMKGDGITLLQHSLGLSQQEATTRFVTMAGGQPLSPPDTAPREKKKKLHLPTDLRRGNVDDWQAVADIRHLDVIAVDLAVEMGVLRFGTVHGFPCWIVIDESRRVAEARRMDGQPFPQTDRLPQRKAHTLYGSDKSWPVGLRPLHTKPHLFKKIMLVEGGPDLLAAYHFLCVTQAMDALPVAMLGRECHHIHPEALRFFSGRNVRIYPHADTDGGGIEAAKRWAGEIEAAGARSITAFNFSGLTREDGHPVTDLNDCTLIKNTHKNEMKNLVI